MNGSGSSSSGEKDKQEDKNVCVSFIPPNYSHSNSKSPNTARKSTHNRLAHHKQQTPQQQHTQSQHFTHPQPQSHPRHPQQEKHGHDVTALTHQHMTRASQLSNTGTVASLIAKLKHVPIPYSIHSYSSHSGAYHPRNICVNSPTQQSSRWSSGSHDHDQFITIQFDKPIIARSITFGKFYKGHVCNLKEYKVYGGMDPVEDLIELLHSGLKNDTEPETFTLKHEYKDLIFPVKYIKIVPLSAFGANFNYSIWYVEIRGIIDESIMQRVSSEYDKYKETETTRLCLKYFRQKNMMDVFYLLKNRTGTELEHPFISNLHQQLVVEADYEAVENALTEALQRQVYQTYSDMAKYVPSWKQITTDECPSPRGGHQMCIDAHDRKIYVFGGWDGRQDLADLWVFDMLLKKWQLKSQDTRGQGGPSPRSCHKICFDSASKSIFVLGKYMDARNTQGQSLESDFFRYYIESDKWVKLNTNTATEGGPELLFDHQMCVDPQGQTLYVFGGRTVTDDTNTQSYSGLYSYHIQSQQWKLIRNDDFQVGVRLKVQNMVPLKSRVGHSMLFDETYRSLYVFAGQRVKDYLSDLYRYDVDTDVVTEIAQDASKDAGPDAGFTQRATIDEELQEIYVFSGNMKNSDGVKNAFWVYSIKKRTWEKLYQNDNKDRWHDEPCPRFAHQMVYDPLMKTQYVFGGNPGSDDKLKRLNDFWELKLTKPCPSALLRKSLYRVRLQRLRELCSRAYEEQYDNNKMMTGFNSYILEALEYLRSQVAPVVNHDDEVESREFHQMCASVCLLETMTNDDVDDSVLSNIVQSEDVWYTERTRLFEKLLEYIPQDMKEPSGKLTNAVRIG